MREVNENIGATLQVIVQRQPLRGRGGGAS
jgi:hypothetical protein